MKYRNKEFLNYQIVIYQLKWNIMNSYYLQMMTDIIYNKSYTFAPKYYLNWKNGKGEYHFMDDTMNGYHSEFTFPSHLMSPIEKELIFNRLWRNYQKLDSN